MTRTRFAVAVDALVAVVCVAVLVVIGMRLWGAGGTAPAHAGAFPDVTGTAVADTVNIDWSAADRTLVLSLHSECRFCTASLPFYRRLLDARGDVPLQVVVTAPAEDAAIYTYLDDGGVRPDRVVTVEPGTLPIAGTPTLFLVDGSGVVTHVWPGQLGDEQETAVLDVLYRE